jgi:hypothetical protein
MADYTYEQLKEMTVADLRQIAEGVKNAELEGCSTMHKDHLLPILCKALGIHIHHAAKGTEKSRIKGLIHKLRAQRDEAIAQGQHAKLPTIRHLIHMYKHQLRRMALLKA